MEKEQFKVGLLCYTPIGQGYISRMPRKDTGVFIRIGTKEILFDWQDVSLDKQDLCDKIESSQTKGELG